MTSFISDFAKDALYIEEIRISMEKNEPNAKKGIDFQSDQKYNMIKI